MSKMSLPEGAVLGAFVPVAYFDHHMDCIHVLTHDRSVTEHRLSDVFTIHECNHRGPFDPMYVGFTIKGVRSVFAQANIPLAGVYTVTDLIDRIAKHSPGTFMAEMAKVILAAQDKTASDLTVDLESERSNAA